ncbi:MAG: class I SAM-dependent methyltransferase [Bacteroidota bacterium]
MAYFFPKDQPSSRLTQEGVRWTDTNIGAGAGSYEPVHIEVVAVEPSLEMIRQRKPDAHPVVQGRAEALPFPDQSFTHALTVLSMHHWEDQAAAFREINRVATQGFVALSWNPAAEPFWLVRDYFPDVMEVDRAIFPSVAELEQHFDAVEITPLPIPEDCVDGFLAAYWKRPAAYLEEAVRASISTFAKMEEPALSRGLTKLAKDLESGRWQETNQAILERAELDTGYIIISGKTRAV